MSRRTELQIKLEELLGSKNVYYQPPSSKIMEYPCIRYTKKNIDSKYANDKTYLNTTLYELIVIDKRPDNPVIDKLLMLPMAEYGRWYQADNLNHDVINIYY